MDISRTACDMTFINTTLWGTVNEDCSSATMVSPLFDRVQTVSPAVIEATLPHRVLKIEASGDFWKGGVKPKIRLMGHWLERAGFKTGNHVSVACVAPGVIELRMQNHNTPEK